MSRAREVTTPSERPGGQERAETEGDIRKVPGGSLADIQQIARDIARAAEQQPVQQVPVRTTRLEADRDHRHPPAAAQPAGIEWDKQQATLRQREPDPPTLPKPQRTAGVRGAHEPQRAGVSKLH
jgi:hypothetical protein